MYIGFGVWGLGLRVEGADLTVHLNVLERPPVGGLLLHELDLWYRGGLVFEAHRLLYPSTLGLRVMKKKREGSYVSAVSFFMNLT